MRFIRLLLANQIAYFFSDLMIDDCIYVIHIYVILWYNTTTHLQNYHYATIQVQIQNYGTIMWRRAYFTIKARAKITLHSFNDDLDPRIDHKLLFIYLMSKKMYLFCCVFCKYNRLFFNLYLRKIFFLRVDARMLKMRRISYLLVLEIINHFTKKVYITYITNL